jgi:hypothetical protein
MNRKYQTKARLLGAFVVVTLGVAACAEAPKAPTDILATAAAAVARADQAGAAQYAELDVHDAHQKLTAAQELAAKKDATADDMKQAFNLADEAQADANLATAKTGAARAQASNADIQKTIDALQQEANRNTVQSIPQVNQ